MEGISHLGFQNLVIGNYSSKHKEVLLERDNEYGKRVLFRAIHETWSPKGTQKHSVYLEARGSVAEKVKKMNMKLGSIISVSGKVGYYGKTDTTPERMMCIVSEIIYCNQSSGQSSKKEDTEKVDTKEENILVPEKKPENILPKKEPPMQHNSNSVSTQTKGEEKNKEVLNLDMEDPFLENMEGKGLLDMKEIGLFI